jgi:uncharacterized protein YecT (DUF1311 family)
VSQLSDGGIPLARPLWRVVVPLKSSTAACLPPAPNVATNTPPKAPVRRCSGLFDSLVRPPQSTDLSIRLASTNMKTVTLLLIFLAAIPLTAFAEVECSDRPECWPEGSSMRTGLLRRAEEEKLGRQLQESYNELVELISTKEIVKGVEHLEDYRLVEAVKAQQKSWNQYKTIECELIGSLSTGFSPFQSAKAVECEGNLTSQRLKRMQHAIRCVKRIPPTDRRFNQQGCLFQLAPMAVPLEK